MKSAAACIHDSDQSQMPSVLDERRIASSQFGGYIALYCGWYTAEYCPGMNSTSGAVVSCRSFELVGFTADRKPAGPWLLAAGVARRPVAEPYLIHFRCRRIFPAADDRKPPGRGLLATTPLRAGCRVSLATRFNAFATNRCLSPRICRRLRKPRSFPDQFKRAYEWPIRQGELPWLSDICQTCVAGRFYQCRMKSRQAGEVPALHRCPSPGRQASAPPSRRPPL